MLTRCSLSNRRETWRPVLYIVPPTWRTKEKQRTSEEHPRSVRFITGTDGLVKSTTKATETGTGVRPTVSLDRYWNVNVGMRLNNSLKHLSIHSEALAEKQRGMIFTDNPGYSFITRPGFKVNNWHSLCDSGPDSYLSFHSWIPFFYHLLSKWSLHSSNCKRKTSTHIM